MNKQKKIKALCFPANKNKHSNPYNYILYSGMSDEVDVIEFSLKKLFFFKCDLIHIHWPEHYLNSKYRSKAFLYSIIFLIGLALSRMRGRKIVWTIHNLKPHKVSFPILNRCFWFLYLKLVSAVISLSVENDKLAKDYFGNIFESRTVIHHGLYNGFYEDSVSYSDARKKLQLGSERVVLFVGQVKGYKNIEEAIDLFKNNDSLNDKKLIIAGKFESESYFHKIDSRVKGNDNIVVYNKFIPDDELQVYFNAADISILPFKEIFNSGSALLSISFNTPVLVPSSKMFEEYKEMLTKDSILTYTSLSALLINETLSSLSKKKSIEVNSENIKWEEISRKTVFFYKELLGLNEW